MANADRIIELLHEAKARPAGAERERFLTDACRDDSALKEQIVSLIEADARDGDSDFLKRTPFIRQEALVTEKPGDRIGRYKLLEQIGEGGCGVVYMAEQLEPVRRRVALKVIKLGMDTKQVIARFEAERQALAMMDHPNIAKIFDAGVTGTPVAAGILPAVESGFQPGGNSTGSPGRGEASAAVAGSEASPGGRMPPSTAGETPAATLSAGRPYFVMELVRGIKITDYCDQNNLSTKERLELFIQVCQAIQHAHQKGIIHRDIKPSNILVTLHDDVAVPKVIDFGIAKATTGQLTNKTVFTAFAQFVGTPAYMSPEQAQMSGLDVDTRADIYSLGVLLYELLTGNTPFDAKELLAEGMDEMRRKIREDEPSRPSICLSTMHAMDLTTVARRRHVEPPKLIHLIRGDLDWLVMKCLEKDRTRRYETANGLAMDIQRHLNNEPVTACPPSRLYEFQKTVQRHKFGFAAAAAVIIVLGLGVLASTWQALRATRAERAQSQLRQQAETARNNEATERTKAQTNEKKAEAEAAKSQQVAQFLMDMLRGVGPSVALGRDTTMLREILDRTAERIGKDLTNQPEVEVELRGILTLTYEELALFKQREKMARETLRVARSRLGEEHPAVADALHQIGDARSRLGDQTEAEKFLGEAVGLKRKWLGNEHPSTVESLNVLAWVFSRQGRQVEAESSCREVLAIRRKLFGNDHAAVADTIFLLGHVLSTQGRQGEAETTHREALAIFGKVLGEEHPKVAESLDNLAVVLHRQGRLAESETMQRDALARRRKLFSPDHWEVAQSFKGLAAVLRAQGKLIEVETLYREELAARKKLLGNEHPEVATALRGLAGMLRDQGKLREAEALDREALAIWTRPGNEDPRSVEALISLVWGLHLQGKPAEAEARAAVAAAQRVHGDEDPMVGLALERLGTALSDQSKPAEAEAVFRAAVKLRRKVLGEHADTAHSLSWLAGSLEAQGKLPEAEAATREALEIRKKLPGSESWAIGSLDYLATLLQKQGKTADAEAVLREALVGYSKTQGVGGDGYIRVFQSLIRLLKSESKLAEGETLCREVLAQQRAAFTNDNPAVAQTLSSLVDSLLAQGKLAEADSTAREAAQKFHTASARYEKLATDRDRHQECWSFAIAYEALGQLFNGIGQTQAAETAYRDTQALWRKLVATFNLEDDRWHLAINYDLLGNLLKETGRFDEAIETYRQALAVWKQLVVEFNLDDRRNHLSWTAVSLATTLQCNGKPVEAERVYRDALEAYAKTPGVGGAGYPLVIQSLIGLLKSENRLAEVENLYQDELALQSKQLGDEDPRVRIHMGTLYRDTGEVDKAIADFSWVIAKDPKRAEVWDLRGNCYLRKGEYAKAVADYSHAIELKPRVGWYWHERAYAHLVLGQHEQAIADHSTAIEISDLDSGQRLRRGQSYEALGELEKAEADYARAIKLNPSDMLVTQSLVRLLKAANKLAEAETLLKVLLSQQRLSPREPPFVLALTLLQLANVLQSQNKAEAATNHFREALAVVSSARVEATNANSVNKLSWGLVTGDEPTSWDAAVAVELAQKAVAATNRKNPILLDTLAAACAASSQFTNAVRVQQEAIALLPDEKQKNDYASRLELYQSGIPYRDHAALARRVSALLAQRKFTEAEPPARQCLTLRGKQMPDDWLTFNARNMLGGSLLGQKKYAEAEPLLLSGYAGMKQREDKIPAIGKPRVKENLQRLVQLYAATGQPDKAAEWNKKLVEFDQAEAEKKTVAPKP